MIIWIDAQMSPALASWIVDTFGIRAIPVRDLSLRNAKDFDIFAAARTASAVVMTKDADFVELVQRLGTPPQVLWVRCGNTSNRYLRDVLTRRFRDCTRLLQGGAPIVELND